MMNNMKDSNIIGVDRLAWDAVWRIHDESSDLSTIVECIAPLLKDHMDPAYHEGLLYACNNNYDIPHLWDSLSENQIQSKIWLVEKLLPIMFEDDGIRAQIWGGWFGFPLIDLLLDKLEFEYIENIDLDDKAIGLFKKIRNLKGYDAENIPRMMGTVGNVMDTNIRDWTTDLVINTSSEHMPPLPEILKGKGIRSFYCMPREKYKSKKKGPCIFALQSNNMFHIEDHINCVNDEDELVKNSGLETILYKGSLDMPNGYKRFMVIGHA